MPEWTFHVTFRVAFGPEAEDQTPELHSVESCLPTGQSPTAEKFRRVPYGEIIRLAEGTFRSPMLALIAEHLGAETNRRPYGGSIEHNRTVATLYRTALGQGIPPREAISEVYGVTLKTVSRWLSEMRSTIDPATDKPILNTYAEEDAKHGLTAGEKKFAKLINKTAQPKKKSDKQKTIPTERKMK